MTAGCATRRRAPALRLRGPAEQRAGFERRRGRCQVRSATARPRGRTIWTKPKPLIAVRSNGCGRCASIAAAARLARRLARDRSASRRRSTRRCRAGGWRAPPPSAGHAPARPAASVPSTSIRVIAGVGAIRSSPPAKRRSPLRASSIRSSQPAAIVLARERLVSASDVGAGARRLVGPARKAALPRLGARQSPRG